MVLVELSDEDVERLRRIAKLIGAETVGEAIRFLLELAEEKRPALTTPRTPTEIIRRALRHARDVGLTDASHLDDYIYGAEG